MGRSIAAAVLASLVSVTAPDWVQAQNDDLPYNSNSTGADGDLIVPRIPGLEAASGAYDTARGQIVFFGGIGVGGKRSSHTWLRDGNGWQRAEPANRPSARTHAAMAYDPVNEQVILFGGFDGSNFLNDTWAWDGSNWTQLNPATAPSARNGVQMVYATHLNQMILFGGNDGSSSLNDTWAWNGSTWTQLNPTTSPSQRWTYGLAYDAARQQVVMYGGWNGSDVNSETWIFNGTTWTQANPGSSPNPVREFSMVYDSNTQRIIMFGGRTASVNSSNWERTHEWNGNTWNRTVTGQIDKRNDFVMVYNSDDGLVYLMSGYVNDNASQTAVYDSSSPGWSVLENNTITIDLSQKADGVFNYQEIFVGTAVTVNFTPNSGNTPVTWLATDLVTIDGTVSVNGQNAGNNNNPGFEAQGGPGGYAGGLGGIRFDISSTFAGQPGSGPGGGLPGTGSGAAGEHGRHRGVYGNAFLQPLQGGSGGGGGASDEDTNGGNGGGGGGAILVSSSRDIVVDGSVHANGGSRMTVGGGAGHGGHGSGGGIRLVADRVLGNGNLLARNGGNTGDEPFGGRIRVEGYFRPLAPNSSPTASASAPTQDLNLGGTPQLLITSVAGNNVQQPPTGSLSNPDVVFTSSGDITITVTAQNIPDGTPVTLRITASGEVIQLPGAGNTATLSGGTVDFVATVPAGLGNIQAFAEFTNQ